MHDWFVDYITRVWYPDYRTKEWSAEWSAERWRQEIPIHPLHRKKQSEMQTKSLAEYGCMAPIFRVGVYDENALQVLLAHRIMEFKSINEISLQYTN